MNDHIPASWAATTERNTYFATNNPTTDLHAAMQDCINRIVAAAESDWPLATPVPVSVDHQITIVPPAPLPWWQRLAGRTAVDGPPVVIVTMTAVYEAELSYDKFFTDTDGPSS